MTRPRLIANIAVGLILFALLIGLVIVIVDERCSRQLDNVDPTNEEMVQNIPFGGDK